MMSVIARHIGQATLIAALAALGFATIAHAQNKACSLATADELQAALGAPVSGLHGQGTPGGAAEICSGQTATARVLLRVAKLSGRSHDAEARGVEMMRRMGAQIDVQTFGPITCSTMVPPKNMERYGFNTTCTVRKPEQVAGIEITAKAQKDMVPIDRLRPLAEKMTSRF